LQASSKPTAFGLARIDASSFSRLVLVMVNYVIPRPSPKGTSSGAQAEESAFRLMQQQIPRFARNDNVIGRFLAALGMTFSGLVMLKYPLDRLCGNAA
jgi:hypothetical protein